MKRTMTLLVVSLLFLAGFVACGDTGASSSGVACGAGDGASLPIVAWNGPPPEHFSDAAFRTLAEAGFNTVFSFVEHDSQNARLLQLAERHGICTLLWSPELIAALHRDDSSISDSLLLAILRDYGRSSELLGFCLRDQPKASEFPVLARAVAALKQAFPNALPYINLYPSYATAGELGVAAYEAYIDSFLSTVRPPLLSFDHYPITDRGLRPDFFYNLEVVRKRSLESGVPFWTFVLSTQRPGYPRPKEPYLRFAIYSALAYGAKGIQYFTYWPPREGGWRYASAVVDAGGRPTLLYTIVSHINVELRRIGALLLSLQSLDVYHTEPVPRNCRRLPENWLVQAEGESNLLFGYFRTRSDKRYLLVVNRDYTSGRIVTLHFARPVEMVREVARSSVPGETWDFRKDGARVVRLLMAAGDGLLLGLSLSGE